MAARLRFKVVDEAFKRGPVYVEMPSERPSEYFAKYVFDRKKMQKYLVIKRFFSIFVINSKRQRYGKSNFYGGVEIYPRL